MARRRVDLPRVDVLPRNGPPAAASDQPEGLVLAARPPLRRPRRRATELLLALAVVVVLSALVAALLGAARPAHTAAGEPPVPTDASSTPLGTPPPAPAGTGGYVFMQTEDDHSGRPVRWDSCRPIHYVVRPDGAPPAGDLLVRQAVDRVSQLTGLVFVSDGTTDEAPGVSRPPMDKARYGDRWSPVLIAWTDPGEYSDMAGAAGRGGPVTAPGRREGDLHYVSGVVYLNGENLRQVAGWNAGRAKIRGVVMHELGHLVGLAHTEDPNQLMYDRQTVLAGEQLGDGDLRGLAALGSGPCFTSR